MGWPELLLVEYKAELPGRDGRPDPWIDGSKVGQYALDKLFKELVALANTSGGHLVVGIAELEEAPPVAVSIRPIPRCVDLAERLGRAAQAIDPPIPLLQVRGVATEPDGDGGVVIFRVPASRSAPHRAPDKDCYVRRDANSVPVSMRDVHDMTLARERRQDRVSEQFDRFSRQFRMWFVLPREGWRPWSGFRISAVPVAAEFDLGRLFGKPLPTQQDSYHVTVDNKHVITLPINRPTTDRPIVPRDQKSIRH